MNPWYLSIIVALVGICIGQAGCTGIGDACGEDVSSLPHTIVECDEGVCVEGVCVESRNEGEICKDGDKSYACSRGDLSCSFSIKRNGFFCVVDKKINEFCDPKDGDDYCLGYQPCSDNEVWSENSLRYPKCQPNVYCINNLCQKSKNENSPCYIGHEFSCLEDFNCVPGNMSVSIPIDAETLESIDRTNGVCKVYAKLNEPCDPQNFIRCEDGLICGQNSICERRG